MFETTDDDNDISFILSELIKISTHSIIGMEYVGGGRVVDDDDTPEVATEAVEVLHVVAAVEHAAVAEQPRAEHTPSGKIITIYLFIWDKKQ